MGIADILNTAEEHFTTLEKEWLALPHAVAERITRDNNAAEAMYSQRLQDFMGVLETQAEQLKDAACNRGIADFSGTQRWDDIYEKIYQVLQSQKTPQDESDVRNMKDAISEVFPEGFGKATIRLSKCSNHLDDLTSKVAVPLDAFLQAYAGLQKDVDTIFREYFDAMCLSTDAGSAPFKKMLDEEAEKYMRNLENNGLSVEQEQSSFTIIEAKVYHTCKKFDHPSIKIGFHATSYLIEIRMRPQIPHTMKMSDRYATFEAPEGGSWPEEFYPLAFHFTGGSITAKPSSGVHILPEIDNVGISLLAGNPMTLEGAAILPEVFFHDLPVKFQAELIYPCIGLSTLPRIRLTFADFVVPSERPENILPRLIKGSVYYT